MNRRGFIAYNGGETATYVRIRGARHRVEEVRANRTRVYFRLADGAKIVLDRSEQIALAYSCDLTTDASWDDVNVTHAEALSVDWGPGCFTEAEIASAYHKLKYLSALDKYDAKDRTRKKIIDLACAQARIDNPELPEKPPSIDSIRRWDYRWLASGRDIRVLADRHQDRGSREGNTEQAWLTDLLLKAIEEKMLQSPYYTPKQLEDHITPEIAAIAKEKNLPLDPRLGAQRYFGVHRIATLYAQMTQEERLRADNGKREAARQGKGVSEGPSGDYPLHEVEADHHRMDIEVRLPDGRVWGRPWLTVIFDRYSRMILGYYLTMEPPSWFSVLRALGMAVLPKADYLKSLNYNFTFGWRCWGSPDFLYIDRGAEFRSLTIKAAMSALNIAPIDVPRARGDLKGKIERWFGTYANGEVSKLPGYIGNSPKTRPKDKAEHRLTMADLNLVCAVFIVDVYNNRRHRTTKQWPSKRFTAAIEGGMIDKLPPPAGLLGPATSKALRGTLTEKGVLVEGSIYRSKAALKLWKTNGRMPLLCRADEADATRILVHDGGRKFFEAELSGPYKGQKLTRRELELLRAADNDMTETAEDHELQLQAQGNYAKLIDRLSPKPRKLRRGVELTKPVEHRVKPTFDPKGSAREIKGYDPNVPMVVEKYEPSGSFDGPTISQQVFERGIDPDTAWNMSRPALPKPLPAPPAATLPAPHATADPPVVPQPYIPFPDDDDDGVIRL